MNDLVSPAIAGGLVSLVVSSLISPLVLERVKRKQDRRNRLFERRLEEYRKCLQAIEDASRAGVESFRTFLATLTTALPPHEQLDSFAQTALRSLFDHVAEVAHLGQTITEATRTLRLVCSKDLLPRIQEVETAHLAFQAVIVEVLRSRSELGDLKGVAADPSLMKAKERADASLRDLLDGMRRELQEA